MYAYVYIKSLNKYVTLKESQIENFNSERTGHQSKEFSSTPFTCIFKNQKHLSQILTVSDMEYEIEEYVLERRPKVPKLNKSDLQLPNDKENLEKQKSKLKVTKSQLSKKNKQSAMNSMTNIVSCYQSSLSSTPLEVQTAGSSKVLDGENHSSQKSLHKKQRSIDDLDVKSAFKKIINKLVSPIISDTDAIDDNESVNRDEFEENILKTNNVTEVIELKNKLLEEKRKRKLAVEVANTLQTRYIAAKEKLAQSEKDEKVSAFALAQNVDAGFPIPLNSKSEILVKRSAVEDAYSKIEPSKFYINICYATWGYANLANRCVKKTRHIKKPWKKVTKNDNNVHKDVKKLTPKKKRAIRAHFVHFLNYYKFPEKLYNMHMSKINDYCHRAIGGARKHMHILEQISDLSDSDNELDPSELIEL